MLCPITSMLRSIPNKNKVKPIITRKLPIRKAVNMLPPTGAMVKCSIDTINTTGSTAESTSFNLLRKASKQPPDQSVFNEFNRINDNEKVYMRQVFKGYIS